MIGKFYLIIVLILILSPVAASQDSEGRICLMADQSAVTEISKWVEARGDCGLGCHGCGCNGGPGYRSTENEQCVGWAQLNEECGPPPHTECIAECTAPKPGCAVPESLLSDVETRLIRWPNIQLPNVDLPPDELE